MRRKHVRRLENNFHSRAQKGRGISPGCVSGMNRDFYIWTNPHASRQTKAIERLENAFMMLTRAARLTIVECHPEHISPASKWTYPGQTDSLNLLNGGPAEGTRGKSSKGCPAAGKLMLESKSAAKSAPIVLGVVS